VQNRRLNILLSVSVSQAYISKTTWRNFAKFSLHVECDCDLVFLWRSCGTLCTYTVLWITLCFTQWEDSVTAKTTASTPTRFCSVFTARCTIVQSAVLRSHVVCPSVSLSLCLSVCPSVCDVGGYDHTGWKTWKLIARTISPPSLLFVAQRSSTYSQGNMEKFWGENVRSTPTSITSGWIESTESPAILSGGMAVCLLLSAHRAVIFAISQLSCKDQQVLIIVVHREEAPSAIYNGFSTFFQRF